MKDEMDILKEVGSTASAQGSTALSEILGRKILLRSPSVDIISSTKIAEVFDISTEKMTISIQTQILSGLQGQNLFIILEEKSAYKLVDIFYKVGENIKKGSLFTEMSMSLIKEIGNIVISAYIGTLGYFLKKVIIPSLPLLINAPLQDIVRMVTKSNEGDDRLLVVESVFEEPTENIKGNFWLILSSGAATEIIESCKKILERLKSD